MNLYIYIFFNISTFTLDDHGLNQKFIERRKPFSWQPMD